jgi:hypothetical protein
MMKNITSIICVVAIMVMACASSTAMAQRAKSGTTTKKAPPPPKRSALFVGADTAGYLPKTNILPKAAEIESRAQKLSSRLRNMDPFGLATFPREDSAPIFDDETMRVTQRVTLNQALQTLRINGVNLKRKEFLIGGRNAMEGDVIELAFKEEVFQAEVLEISATEILFRDIQRKETGVLRHSVVPHFDGEPMRNVASRAAGRMTPIEPVIPPRE